MQTRAEIKLNPLRYYLSPEARKRLKWMYIIHYECDSNIKQAAHRIGVSRPWLSQMHTKWEHNSRNPRALEPESRTPHHTDKRRRIKRSTEDTIVAIRKQYKTWGKDKITGYLQHQRNITVSPSTVNRYLRKHKLINLKLSHKNQTAWRNNMTHKTNQIQNTSTPGNQRLQTRGVN